MKVAALVAGRGCPAEHVRAGPIDGAPSGEGAGTRFSEVRDFRIGMDSDDQRVLTGTAQLAPKLGADIDRCNVGYLHR